MTFALLFTVLIVLLIAFAVFWLIDQIGLPSPINMIAKAVVALGAIGYILQQLGVM